MLRILFAEAIYIVDEGGSVEICVNIEDTNFVIDERLVFTLGLAPVGGTASGKNPHNLKPGVLREGPMISILPKRAHKDPKHVVPLVKA